MMRAIGARKRHIYKRPGNLFPAPVKTKKYMKARTKLDDQLLNKMLGPPKITQKKITGAEVDSPDVFKHVMLSFWISYRSINNSVATFEN